MSNVEDVEMTPEEGAWVWARVQRMVKEPQTDAATWWHNKEAAAKADPYALIADLKQMFQACRDNPANACTSCKGNGSILLCDHPSGRVVTTVRCPRCALAAKEAP